MALPVHISLTSSARQRHEMTMQIQSFKENMGERENLKTLT